MLYPVPWDNQDGNGITFGPRASTQFYQDAYRFHGPSYSRPDGVCQGDLCHYNPLISFAMPSIICPLTSEKGLCSGCSIQGCREDWFTNHTFIPGLPTLPDNMYQYLDCTPSITGSSGIALYLCVFWSIH